MEEKQEVRNIVSVSLKDKTALHANYMPFIKGGGLYVATDKIFKFGDSIVISLQIASIAKKFAIPGKVVWLSPLQAQGAQGVGVQFTGESKGNVKMALESVLGDLASKPSIYHTY